MDPVTQCKATVLVTHRVQDVAIIYLDADFSANTLLHELKF